MPQMRQVMSGASVKLRPLKKASKKRGGSKIFNCTRVTAPSLIWMLRPPSPSTRARYLTVMLLLVMGFALLAEGGGVGVKGPEGPHQVGLAHSQPLAEPRRSRPRCWASPWPWIVSDELWSRIEPLLPKVERRFRYPGRKRLPDRQALQGILFVLYTGIAWRHLPPELGFGGGSTCHRRMDEWQRAGVWERLHEVLLAELRAAGSSSGRGRSRTQVMCRRKRGLRDGPEPG